MGLLNSLDLRSGPTPSGFKLIRRQLIEGISIGLNLGHVKLKPWTSTDGPGSKLRSDFVPGTGSCLGLVATPRSQVSDPLDYYGPIIYIN